MYIAAHGYSLLTRSHQCVSVLLEKNSISDEGARAESLKGYLSHRNSHLLDEMQQRRLLLHVRIICECGISPVESTYFCAAAKLVAVWVYLDKL
ncbi:hypothetical protein EVAR_75495_1 [Eumeta japonica]|uniref:Uncharacterized protein n=1 Tax=Eumeta variegata TaxID=151549 RepID=A0A4C1TK92_EUMVA|nr:hypothetical protein EVAR_75495_1 [Eumeta japonica]